MHVKLGITEMLYWASWDESVCEDRDESARMTHFGHLVVRFSFSRFLWLKLHSRLLASSGWERLLINFDKLASYSTVLISF